MASVKTITLPDGSSYDFKATYDIEGNNISETYINKNEKGAASGVAPLNSSGKIDESYLPSSGSSSGGSSDFVSESGSLVQFDYSKADVPFSSLKVKITPIQSGSGDPSPSNIRPITGYDSVMTIHAGKNMLPQLISGRSINANTGANNGTAGDNLTTNCATEEFIPVNLNVSNFVIGYDDANDFPSIPSIHAYCYDADKSYLGRISGSTANPVVFKITSPHSSYNFDNADVRYVKIRYYFAEGSGHTWTQAMCDGAHFRMNMGNVLNDYAPYEAPDIYTSDFTSAGTVYGGELDVLSGKLTVDRVSVTINGSESYWYSVSSNNKIYSVTSSNLTLTPVHESLDLITNQGYTPTLYNYTTMANNIPSVCVRGNEESIWRIYLCTENTTLDALKTSLAANPLQVVYPLKTPLTYQLTPSEVTTLLGQNNVWSDAGEVELTVLPSGVRDYLDSLILVVTQNSSTGELTLS